MTQQLIQSYKRITWDLDWVNHSNHPSNTVQHPKDLTLMQLIT